MADVKRLQIRRDTLADWVSVNPILLEGEVGLIIENGGISSLKIGDGVSSFTQLKQLTLLEAVFGGYVSRQDLSASLRDYATIQYVDSEIGNILGGASGAYDTLKEIEDILENDTTGLAALLTEIGTKADTSVVDALDGRVAANEMAISTVSPRLEKVENGLIATQEEVRGYSAIISELQGTVKLKADQSSVDSLAEAIEAINEGIADLTTDDVYEGTNKYFTNARAVAALDGASLNSLKVGGYGVSENIQALIQSAASVSGDISKINVRIEGLDGDIKRIDGYCDEFNASIGNLESSVRTNTTDIAGIVTRLDNLDLCAITESTVSGWGFTKNAGTITGIKMNGASKGTSGVVDLGTVLTSHQTIHSLTIKNSDESYSLTYTPNSSSLSITLGKSWVGLGNVENTKLSTWEGSANITTLGTITSGTWKGSKIGQSYLDLSGYLPLSGGTVDGYLYVGAAENTEYRPLIFRRNGHGLRINTTGTSGYISFGALDSNKLDITAERAIVLGDSGFKYSPDFVNYYDIIHSGNISDYALAKDSNGTVLLNGTLYVDGAGASIEIKEGAIKSNLSGTDSWSIDDSGNGKFAGSLTSTGLNISKGSSSGAHAIHIGHYASWGDMVYPTIYSDASDKYIMTFNLHVARSAKTSSNYMNGANVRLESINSKYWDISVGHDDADTFKIRHNGATDLLTIDVSSIYALSLNSKQSVYSIIHFLANNSTVADIGWLNDRGNFSYIYNNSSTGSIAVNSSGAYFSTNPDEMDMYALIHSGNIGTYAVTSGTLDDFPRLNGTSPSGASATGTWGINISGSAAKLSTARTIWGQSFDGIHERTNLDDSMPP